MKLELLMAFIIGALVGSCCFSNQAPLSVPHDTPSTAWRSTVKLQVRQVGNSLAFSASGFPIDKERIMTAGHFCVGVVKGQITGALKDDIEIVFLNNNDEVNVMTGGWVETVDEQMDICIVRRVHHGVTPLELADYSQVRIHDKIEVVGAPLGVFPTSTEGRISVLKTQGWPVVDLNDRLIVSASVTGGNSGGPILSEDGKVIGILMAVHSRYPHLAIGVHVDMILDYMQQEYGE